MWMGVENSFDFKMLTNKLIAGLPLAGEATRPHSLRINHRLLWNLRSLGALGVYLVMYVATLPRWNSSAAVSVPKWSITFQPPRLFWPKIDLIDFWSRWWAWTPPGNHAISCNFLRGRVPATHKKPYNFPLPGNNRRQSDAMGTPQSLLRLWGNLKE